PAIAANDRWMTARRRSTSDLSSLGVDVRVVAQSRGGGRDRVVPPLPLGHPDVVAAVEEVLGAKNAVDTDPSSGR
ncbi:MAG: hypothetical protein M3443_09395, partial [Actinomycetota bacterium]|nr:hypothetical protein [Actinomycetota bacterium]